MAIKQYPVGTRIRFIYNSEDYNKIGTIVGLQHNGNPIIFLPTADKHGDGYYPVLPDGTKFTWRCSWQHVELLALPNRQILFGFMYNG